jgi:hypothetical protein
MEEPRALRRRRLRPVALDRGARRLDRPVDVLLAGEGDLRQRLARRGLRQLADLAVGRLRELAVDEEAIFALGRDRPRAGR